MKIFAETDRFILREVLLTDVEGLYELDSDPTAVIALNHAFKNLKVEEVFAAASCENVASNRILQKLGLHFIETFYYEDIKCNWYKIDKAHYDVRGNSNGVVLW